MSDRTVALAGNPNTGKSSLFNALTGGAQHVGNWPGKTVEMRSGVFRCDGVEFGVVDLPGTYSLAALSEDERIAAGFLIDSHPDAVITVVDAANLERNLYLVVQIAEMGLRQVVALNMADVAERRGLRFGLSHLEQAFGAGMVLTVARRGTGVDQLRCQTLDATGEAEPLFIDYGDGLEAAVRTVAASIEQHSAVAAAVPMRWAAVELLAGHEGLTERLESLEGGEAVLRLVEERRRQLEETLDEDIDLAVADRRYRWIHQVAAAALSESVEAGRDWSERIDRVVLNRFLGLPIFLFTMWVVFKLTTDVAAAYLDWVDAVISGPVSRWTVALLGLVGLDGTWVQGLLVDGVLAGVGGVLVFIPVLVLLYLALGLLEDSGYMARAAFVMHRAMRTIGLPGTAFLPMLVGFGCTVPAVYATRTLHSSRDRILTGLLVPFMSCGARLPVYVLMASVFFPRSRGTVVFSMYLLGIAVAVLLGAILSRTLLRQREQTPLVMELPALRWPDRRTIHRFVRQRTLAFVKSAGTVILAASVVVWLLLAIPVGGSGSFGEADIEDSAFAGGSRVVAPALDPLGLGDWELAGALASGFVAKEIVVSTLSETYGLTTATEPGAEQSVLEDLGEIGRGLLEATETALRSIPSVAGINLGNGEQEPADLVLAVREGLNRSSNGHGSLAALAFMVFVLLYTPCVAAIAAIRSELGSRWMWISISGQTTVAWLGAFIVFQGGRLLGLG
jgi:ferrous iron transport protein B